MTSYKVSGRFIEIYFDEMPDKKIRETLKLLNWRWYGQKQCWSNFYNDENLETARSICKELNPEENPLSKMVRVTLEPVDVVIRCNSFYCNKNHKVEDVAGIIHIANRRGDIEEHLVPMARCVICNTYYILEGTYKSMKKYGVIMHTVYTYKSYLDGYTVNPVSTNDFVDFRDESDLKIWGYSVNSIDDYTDEQRWAILEMLVDKKIMSRDRILSYLDFFQRTHPNMNDAIDKWQRDYRYIQNYRLGSAIRKTVGKIIIH